MSINKTSISTDVINLDEFFPKEDTPGNNILKKEDEIISLDGLTDTEDETEEVSEGIEGVVTQEPIIGKAPEAEKPEVSTEGFDVDKLDGEFEEARSGKKADLIDFFKEKIESGEMLPFNDYDDKTPIDAYLKGFKVKDFDELWKSNMDMKQEKFAEELPKAFEASLPDQLKFAANYVHNGGTDLKGLFKALAQVEEVKSLDPEKNPRAVAKQYLDATQFGNDEEVAEQLDEWEDMGVIVKKASSFKPKLDLMEESLVQQKIAEQEELQLLKQQQFQFFNDNVVDAIKSENLHGIKLDKKTQSSLYSGLTQYDFTDSRGKRCTEFEYLMDKALWVEPDYETIAMVHWVLKNREEFIQAVSAGRVNKEVEATVRMLKTDTAKNSTNSIATNSYGSNGASRSRGVPRKSTLFKRN